mgnify:CR=1 FL=1
MTKFNINESEKNRIRRLHKNHSIIKEQDIDVEVEPVGIDPMGPVGDKPSLQAPEDKTSTKPGPSAPSNIPCSTIMTQLQAATGVPQYWQSPNVQQMIPAICSKCTSHYNSWVAAGSPVPITGDWANYGAQGQQICLLLINNPQCCNPSTNHECQNGQCIQDPNGQYTSLAQCQQNCSATVNCAALIPNWHTTVDQKEANAIGGGNGCNWICNKVNSLMSQQPFPNTPQGIRKQCKLDYVQAAANNVPCTNSNTGNCTSGNQATVSQNFITSVTNYTANQGCYGNAGSQGNPTQWSACGRKAQFCAGSSAMDIAKCSWLTTFVATNNCNC